MIKNFGKAWLVAAAVILSANARVDAAVIPLGDISSPSTLSISQGGLIGPFSDSYTFTIGTGLSFDFSSFISTGFATRYGIMDFIGSLYDESGLVADGISSTRYLPGGIPAYDINFDPVVLDAGSYHLDLSGTGVAPFPGPTASYDGTLTFVAAAVPEPTSLALLFAGLAGLGLLGIRPRRS